jgi:hypothetical protein
VGVPSSTSGAVTFLVSVSKAGSSPSIWKYAPYSASGNQSVCTTTGFGHTPASGPPGAGGAAAVGVPPLPQAVAASTARPAVSARHLGTFDMCRTFL